MRRGRKPKLQSIGTTADRTSSGSFHIGGTSTRPLITFTDDQRPVILEDKPHVSISSPPTSILASNSETTPKKFTEEIHAYHDDDDDDDDDDDVKMEDDRVYCLCKRMYDGRTMIACDRCDDWYHNDCVGINDDMVELVDVFICPTCAPGAERSTTWKTRCARPGCHSAARTLSKYCTDWCGLKTVSNRLDRSSIDQLDFWDSVRSVNRPQAVIQVHNNQEEEEAEAEKGTMKMDENGLLKNLRTELQTLIDRKSHLDSQIRIVTTRLSYLRFAIYRWEKMCIETARALASQETHEFDQDSRAVVSLSTSVVKAKKGPAKGKAAKSKVALKKASNGLDSATGSNEAPCGFDVRLVWDDRDWIPWSSSEEFIRMMSDTNLERNHPSNEAKVHQEEIGVGGSRSGGGGVVEEEEEEVEKKDLDLVISEGMICLIMKKRCDRHMGWQKTKENDFQTELETLSRSVEKIRFEEEKIGRRIEEEEQLNGFRLAKALGHRMDLMDDSVMMDGALMGHGGNHKKKLTGRKKKVQKMKNLNE